MKKRMWIVVVLIVAMLATACQGASGNKVDVFEMEGFKESYGDAVEFAEAPGFNLEDADVEDLSIRVGGVHFEFQTDAETEKIKEIKLEGQAALGGEDDQEVRDAFQLASTVLLKTLHPQLDAEEITEFLAELKIPDGGSQIASVIYEYEEVQYSAVMSEGHRPVLRVMTGEQVTVADETELELLLVHGQRAGKYTGDMVNEQPDGFGRFTTKNTEGEEWYYEGYFKAGRFEGYGKCVWPNSGQIEEGEFKSDSIDGYGKITRNGYLNYEGGVKGRIRDGFGTSYYSNGAVQYQGDFNDDMAHGQGILYRANGDVVFEGEFINSAPSGEAAFKEKCYDIPYQELARNPDAYLGAPVRITGKLVQVMESDNNTVEFRMATKGSYDDIIYFNYTRKEGELRALEDDAAEIWGSYEGLLTYETVMGNSVTIPNVSAYFMEIR